MSRKGVICFKCQPKLFCMFAPSDKSLVGDFKKNNIYVSRLRSNTIQFNQQPCALYRQVPTYAKSNFRAKHDTDLLLHGYSSVNGVAMMSCQIFGFTWILSSVIGSALNFNECF